MWSYSGDPSTSDKDAVRFYIGDIDESLQLLQDEDIDFLLKKWLPLYGSDLLVAAGAAEIIANHFAREVSVSADGVSVASNELQQKYNDLAANLRDMYKIEQIGTPILPGVLYDNTWDSSIKPLRFGIGFTDNYEAGRQDYGDYDPSGYPNGYNEPATSREDVEEVDAKEIGGEP
jgi:hypothetical protein